MRRLRCRTLVRAIRGRLDASRWQIWMALVASAVIWLGLFLLFYVGFRYLSGIQWISGYLIELLFSLFFSTLWVMLIFSTGIILFAGLFSSPQSRSMLVLPIAADQIFAYKFQEALLFSSWGFLILGSPLLVAYGLIVDAPWHFYGLGLVFFLFFCLLSGSLGGLLCLLITLLVPRSKRELAIAGGVVLIGLGLVKAVGAWQTMQSEGLSQISVLRFLERLRLSKLPVWPSHWMGIGLQALAEHREFKRSLLYLLVLVSNALLAYLVAAAAHRLFYRKAYDRLRSQSIIRRRSNRAVLSRLLDRLFAFLPVHLRALAVKDAKTFLRDPLQFLQLLILAGLLSMYIVSLGTMQIYAQSPYLKTMIGLLNLFVMALFLNVFASRFVFPMLSLEGQRMWVLGLCPISRDAILWSKFALSASGSCLLLLALTALNVLMLHLSPVIAGMQLVLVPVLCCGVSGLAVGLGARFADLKETDPSKLAAGLGGTLNLVASLLFIVAAITAIVVPSHFYTVRQLASTISAGSRLRGAIIEIRPEQMGLAYAIPPSIWIALGICASIALGVAATWLPMKLGIRAFRKMEA